MTEELTELKVVLNSETLEMLEKLKNLLAHQIPNATYAELISYLAKQGLQQVEKKKGLDSQPLSPAAVKEKEAAPDGKRCQSRYAIQIDHQKPLGRNGKSEFSNYRMLCRGHNTFYAVNDFGEEHMKKFQPSIHS